MKILPVLAIVLVAGAAQADTRPVGPEPPPIPAGRYPPVPAAVQTAADGLADACRSWSPTAAPANPPVRFSDAETLAVTLCNVATDPRHLARVGWTFFGFGFLAAVGAGILFRAVRSLANASRTAVRRLRAARQQPASS